MRIFLLRHGETDWNLQGRCQGITDLDLNERGKQQAREVAADLGTEKIDAIYSSDLKRALQTAEIIGRSQGVAVGLDSDLRELDHGAFEGLTFAEIRAAHPDFLEKWRSEPARLLVPGGERLADVAERAWRGIQRIASRHSSGETLVVVSHSFPIVAILCRVTGTPLDQYRSFRVDPCGLAHLDYNDQSRWRVVRINGVGYPAHDRRSLG